MCRRSVGSELQEGPMRVSGETACGDGEESRHRWQAGTQAIRPEKHPWQEYVSQQQGLRHRAEDQRQNFIPQSSGVESKMGSQVSKYVKWLLASGTGKHFRVE